MQEASLLFSIGATAVVWMGLKVTGTAEKFLGLGMILMLLGAGGGFFPVGPGPVEEILYAHWTWGIPVFNIAVILAYAVQYITGPGFRDRPEKLVLNHPGGTGISFLILALVPLAVFLMLPGSRRSPRWLLFPGDGPWGNPLFYLLVNFAFCAMLTSFWAIAESFLTNCIERLGFRSERDFRSRALCLAFIVLPPIFLASSGLVGFVSAILAPGPLGASSCRCCRYSCSGTPGKGRPGTLLAVRMAGRSLDPASGAGGVPWGSGVYALLSIGGCCPEDGKQGCEKCFFTPRH